MCSATKCLTCEKTTWVGCGAHVASVKASVPPDQWCNCPPDKRKPEGGCVIQ